MDRITRVMSLACVGNSSAGVWFSTVPALRNSLSVHAVLVEFSSKCTALLSDTCTLSENGWSGRSGDRIPMGGILRQMYRPALRSKEPMQGAPGLFYGDKAAAA